MEQFKLSRREITLVGPKKKCDGLRRGDGLPRYPIHELRFSQVPGGLEVEPEKAITEPGPTRRRGRRSGRFLGPWGFGHNQSRRQLIGKDARLFWLDDQRAGDVVVCVAAGRFGVMVQVSPRVVALDSRQ